MARNLVDDLLRLRTLHNEGDLSDAQFEQAKATLLTSADNGATTAGRASSGEECAEISSRVEHDDEVEGDVAPPRWTGRRLKRARVPTDDEDDDESNEAVMVQ